MPDDWNALARKFGYENEKDMLDQMYTEDGLSISELSKRLGVATFTINRHLEACKVERRKRGGANNKAEQTRKLFRLDQRVVLSLELEALSELVGVSRSLCYKYRMQHTKGVPYEFLYHLAGSRFEEVFEPLSDTSTSTPTGQTSGIQEVLPREEGS